MYYKKDNIRAIRRLRLKKAKYCLGVNNGKVPLIYNLPIGYILRDLLKVSKTLKGAKRYMRENVIVVGNTVVRDIKFPVSFIEPFTVNGSTYKLRLFKNRKTEVIRTDNKTICSPIISYRRISGEKVQVNTMGGYNYLIDNKYLSNIVVGSSICFTEGKKSIISLKPTSVVTILKGKYLGTEMVYKGYANNQWIIEDMGKTKEVRYNHQDFFPISGEVVEIK
jgi:ribosomal protein S4E